MTADLGVGVEVGEGGAREVEEEEKEEEGGEGGHLQPF